MSHKQSALSLKYIYMVVHFMLGEMIRTVSLKLPCSRYGHAFHLALLTPLVMILIVYVNTTVFITQGNYIGYMFRLLNSHLQVYSLQVKSQDSVHTLGSQCVYKYNLTTQGRNYMTTGPILTGKRQ